MEFLEKQLKLKIMIVDTRLNLEHLRQLTLIIEKMPKLEVIKINWRWENGCNEIARIMATRTKLKKVVLFELTNDMFNELRRITDSQWQFGERLFRSANNGNEITFIRRN